MLCKYSQMKCQRPIGVDQFRMKIVYVSDGLFYVSILNGVPYFDSFVQWVGVVRIAYASFDSEFVGRFFETLFKIFILIKFIFDNFHVVFWL